ncbi:MAG TPA: hypothetical protein VF950_05960 [Planctomycetota bacterium]
MEREIDATRRRLQERTKSLERRLKPEALLRPVQRRLAGTLGAGGGKILDAFRDHPLPLALTGLGLGWLLLRDLKESTSKVKETAADVVHKAGETAQRTSDWFSATLEERPLLLAVGALAAGLAAAFAVPMTAREERAGAEAPQESPVQGDDAPPGGLPSA